MAMSKRAYRRSRMKQARVLGGHTRKGIGSFKKTPASLYTHIIVYRKGRKVRLPRPEVLS